MVFLLAAVISVGSAIHEPTPALVNPFPPSIAIVNPFAAPAVIDPFDVVDELQGVAQRLAEDLVVPSLRPAATLLIWQALVDASHTGEHP